MACSPVFPDGWPRRPGGDMSLSRRKDRELEGRRAGWLGSEELTGGMDGWHRLASSVKIHHNCRRLQIAADSWQSTWEVGDSDLNTPRFTKKISASYNALRRNGLELKSTLVRGAFRDKVSGCNPARWSSLLSRSVYILIISTCLDCCPNRCHISVADLYLRMTVIPRSPHPIVVAERGTDWL